MPEIVQPDVARADGLDDAVVDVIKGHPDEAQHSGFVSEKEK